MISRLEKLLLFLTVLFLPTQLGKHFWPQFSFVYSLPIDYLSPTLYFWDILAAGLWVVFLIQGKHINRIALNLFYFFILTQSLSLFSVNASFEVGLVRIEQYTITGLFGVYIASVNFKKTIFWALVLAILVQGFLAVVQFIKEQTLGFWLLGERSFSLTTPGIAKFDFYNLQFLRPYGTFPHPNVLAAFMVIVGIILFKETRFRSIAILAGLVTLLTVSRVAIVAGLVSVLIFFKKSRLLILVAVLLLLPILYTRFSAVFNFDYLTIVRRVELSKIALNLWIKSPILGIGLNNFIPTAADLLLSGPSRFLQPVHNILLLALSETGIIGLLGWLVLLIYPIKSRMTICWVIVIFLGLFDHYFLTLPQGYRLLFLVWGLSLSVLEYSGGYFK